MFDGLVAIDLDKPGIKKKFLQSLYLNAHGIHRMILSKRDLLPTWLASAHRGPVYASLDANSKPSAMKMSKFSKSVFLARRLHLRFVLTFQPSSIAGKNASSSSTCLSQYPLHKDHNKALPRPPSRIHFVRHGFKSLYYHRLRKLEGYHFGVLCCAVLAAVVLIINLIFTIWAVSSSGVQNGLGTLQDGSCKRTATLTFWIHLAINILSTLLLGASNYSMQCLSSPTRDEIDKAHGQGVWLDIGVPSVRNLRRLSTTRIVLWWLLAVSSVPLHLLYNSAVFSTLCTRRYNVALVSREFVDGAPFDVTLFSVDGFSVDGDYTDTLLDYQKNHTSLVTLDNKACVEIYTAPIISTYSDLILVSTYSNATNSLLYYDQHQDSQLIIGSPGGSGICSLPILKTCNASRVIANPLEWSIDIPEIGEGVPLDVYYGSAQYASTAEDPSIFDGTRIQYCLSKGVKEHCKLQCSLVIMIVVIVCNLVKTICMSIIAWKQDPEPLVTLGDAIASFLDRPDVKSKGNCVLGKTRFRESRFWGSLISRWDLKRLRWFRAASRRRWLVCNIL